MKKILISIPNLFGGGAERVASLWANSLCEQGYDVAFLLCNSLEGEYYTNDNIKRFVLADNYAKYKSLGLLKTIKMIRKTIKTYKPDVLINFLSHWQIVMMFATWGLKLPKIETVRISPWAVFEKSRTKKFLWKKAFKKSTRIIIQTDEQAEYFSSSVQKKCVTIANPVDKCYEDTFKTEYSRVIKNFVAMGRIDPQKNYPLMIQSFSELIGQGYDLTLSIYGVGSEDYTKQIQSLIDNLGHEDKIKLAGRTNNVCNVLANADAFIITSNSEGMSNALLEAMVSKLPCISTDCRTGPKDMIDDGVNGFLAKTGDLESVKESILKVLSLNKDQSQQIGERARTKILEICSQKNSFEKLLQLIKDCTK